MLSEAWLILLIRSAAVVVASAENVVPLIENEPVFVTAVEEVAKVVLVTEACVAAVLTVRDTVAFAVSAAPAKVPPTERLESLLPAVTVL